MLSSANDVKSCKICVLGDIESNEHELYCVQTLIGGFDVCEGN